jgi:tetratricopeptide (TPR) repeat protein
MKGHMKLKTTTIPRITAAVLTAFLLLAPLTSCARSEKPLTAAELLDLGEKYLLELDYEQAIVQFTKLIEIEPKNARAYTGLAEAYTALGRTDEAIEILEQGLAQLPDNADILAMLEALRPPEPAPEPETIADYAVEWVDPAFEKMIRQGLNKPDGVIMRSELDFVTILHIYGNTHIYFNLETTPAFKTVSVDHYSVDEISYNAMGTIRQLNDVRNFIYLAGLFIGYNNISDISPLAGLTNLKALTFYGNEISDISPLANLTNLEGLDLRYNHITDISPLAGLLNLTYLTLDHNGISDITPLSRLTNLELLDLSDNEISDISVLSGLSNLTMLWLLNNPVTDWAPASHVAHMEGPLWTP